MSERMMTAFLVACIICVIAVAIGSCEAQSVGWRAERIQDDGDRQCWMLTHNDGLGDTANRIACEVNPTEVGR